MVPGAAITCPRRICSRFIPRRRAPILSPAWAYILSGRYDWTRENRKLTLSSSLRNISKTTWVLSSEIALNTDIPIPIKVVLMVDPWPMISTSAPLLAVPRSTYKGIKQQWMLQMLTRTTYATRRDRTTARYGEDIFNWHKERLVEVT